MSRVLKLFNFGVKAVRISDRKLIRIGLIRFNLRKLRSLILARCHARNYLKGLFNRAVVIVMLGVNFLTPSQGTALSTRSTDQLMQFYSQASQDQFVYTILYELLDKEDEGCYLEIGAGDPCFGNNSYVFEKQLGWKGVSIDIDNRTRAAWYSVRHNSLLIEDAMQTDYRVLLKPFPRLIDYLSLDIDYGYDTVLKRLPFDEYIFKVITIEHDFYRFGDKYRQEERRILIDLGYYLLCPDVMVFFNGKNCVFEDWWIHPSVFPDDLLTKLKSLDLKKKMHHQIISSLRDVP